MASTNRYVRDAGLDAARIFRGVSRDGSNQTGANVFESLYVNGRTGERTARIGGDAEVSGSWTTPQSTGARNVAVGVDADADGDDAVAIGRGATASGARSTAVGAGASASGDDSVAIGRNASATADHSVAVGENTISGAARMRYRGQIVADEAWIGGGVSAASIDNDGNVVRGPLFQRDQLWQTFWFGINLNPTGTTRLGATSRFGGWPQTTVVGYDAEIDAITFVVDDLAQWTTGTVLMEVHVNGAVALTTPTRNRGDVNSTLSLGSNDGSVFWTGLGTSVSAGDVVELFVTMNNDSSGMEAGAVLYFLVRNT